eukprot:5066704-Pleurochrysis_carterae.AAC.1
MPGEAGAPRPVRALLRAAGRARGAVLAWPSSRATRRDGGRRLRPADARGVAARRARANDADRAVHARALGSAAPQCAGAAAGAQLHHDALPAAERRAELALCR